jgi:hypothetical protein
MTTARTAREGEGRMSDLEAVYEAEIAPLLRAAGEVAQAHGIPFATTFQTRLDEGGGEGSYVTLCHEPEGTGEYLTERIREAREAAAEMERTDGV